jgi:acetyl esterase/lipase
MDTAPASGWAYLGVSINNAVYTLNAFRPNRRSKLLFGWSFFASWLWIELAPYILVLQVLVTGLFVRKGALRTTPGKVGMVLTLGTWAGMAATIRQSYAARNEVREALRDLAEVDLSEPLPIRWERRIQFARAGGKALRMDIVRPDVEDVPGQPRPALIQLHGGGWVLGFKDRQGQLLMRRMASRGWVCCNIDYRLSPAATFPDHLIDVKRAIAWVREHADELGIDPGFIAITGGSAGGHLTALAALTANQERYQPGFERADTSVVAAVPFYGVYDFTNRNGVWPPDTQRMFLAPYVMKCDPDENPELWTAASPIDQVHSAAPPFFVIHGDKDVLAPVEDARTFVEALREVSEHPVYYLELKGAQHAFETFTSIRANAVVDSAARFLQAVFDAYLTGPGAVATPEEVVEAVEHRMGADLADDTSDPTVPSGDGDADPDAATDATAPA